MRKKGIYRAAVMALSSILLCTGLPSFAASGEETPEVTLRVCNWEEYIDEGDWDKEDTISLENGDIIIQTQLL